MDREELTKDRSVARCIAEGYRLFSSQQLTILRKTWKPLVTSSVGWALSVTMALNAYWIGMAAALLLALTAWVLFKRATFQMIAPFPKWGRATKRVLRHLGSYLTYALLSGIVCLVVFSLLLLPAFVLLTAGHIDHMMVMEGDPEVLGTGYWVMTTATLAVGIGLVLYAQTWQTFGATYLYGSMVAHDEARRRQRAQAKTWITDAG